MCEEINSELLSEKKLIFILDQVHRNQGFHDSCYDRMGDHAYKIQGYILLSASALIGFASSSISENYSPLGFGSLFMGLHILLCGGYLMKEGMLAGSVQSLGNEPDHLLSNDLLSNTDLVYIADEIHAKQIEITSQRELNSEKGKVLNYTIMCALLSPVTFIAIYIIAGLITCGATSFL